MVIAMNRDQKLLLILFLSIVGISMMIFPVITYLIPLALVVAVVLFGVRMYQERKRRQRGR